MFWTGGWDSTFRMLQLVIIEEKRVQPYFIVRSQGSVGFEISAMLGIRAALLRKFPDAKERLLPTRFINNREIICNGEIHKLMKYLQKESKLADQYRYLSAFCEQNDIYDMELSVEKSINYKHRVFDLIKKNLDFSDNKISRSSIHNGSEQFNRQVYELFKYFRFPITKITKSEMREIAIQNDFEDILLMTWFCATPKKGEPCGFCGPCVMNIKENQSFRIPFFRKVLSKIHMPVRVFYRNHIKYGSLNKIITRTKP